jgi:hypothetical protein
MPEKAKYRACCGLAKEKLSEDLRSIAEKEQEIFEKYLCNPDASDQLDPVFRPENALGALAATLQAGVAFSSPSAMLLGPRLLVTSADSNGGGGQGDGKKNDEWSSSGSETSASSLQQQIFSPTSSCSSEC